MRPPADFAIGRTMSAMTDERRIWELVQEVLDTNKLPDEVCADCPELLWEVQKRWKQARRVDSQLEALFPSSDSASPPAVIDNRQFLVEGQLPAIPGYKVDAVLGHGGMGIVYKARHLKLNRPVALKMMLYGAVATSSEQARFQREAEAVAALHHPHIVPIYDVGEADGRPYYTMEFLEGGSLARKLAGKPQPAAAAASSSLTLAEAVQAAHSAGIIHRDLKPSNTLLTADGELKISDFGLARRLDVDQSLTWTAANVGTPSYMAPEQALGKANAFSPAVDIYALGALLYEMLTGRPPFRAETAAETQRQLITEEPVPPSRLNASVPRDLETICLKCLHKEPARRYRTAAVLADDLGRFQRGEPISARRVGVFERFWKWVRRHPGPAIAAASVAILVVIAVLTMERFLWGRAELLRGMNDDLAAIARFERAGDWNNAREALERARGRLGEEDVSNARARLHQSERELQLVADLAAIRLSRAELAGEHFNLDAAAARYEKTFDAAGLNVQALGAATVAKRINASPIRNELIAALDDWATCVVTVAQLERIYDVARRADPDPGWRDKVRDASIINKRQALTDLAAAAPIADQSASILVALAHRIELAKGNSVPFCRRVQRQYPNDFWANFQLASVLQVRRDPESISYYLAARAIRPDVLVVNLNLSAELSYHGRAAESLEYHQRAVQIDPRSALAYSDLGVCLGQLGRYDEAVAACRNALAIDPKSYFAVGVMCQALIDDGRLAEANETVRKCLKEMPRNDPDYAGLNRLAAHCEELVKREHQLSDVLAGKQQITPNRRRQLAIVCLVTRRYGDAVRFYDEAFAAEPALADDVLSDARLEAACAAVRAAEQARDMPERVRLLNKAIAWLHADLAVWSGVLDRGKELERQLLLKHVYQWRWEPRFASIRDREAILGWPPEQQAQCRALWQDANVLIMRAEAAAPSADVDTQIASDLLVQGRERVAKHDWAGAVNSYASTLARGPNDDGHFWFEYAAVLLLSGDRPGYRAACTHLIERRGKPGGPRAYHVARAGTLAADGAPDVSALGQLAEKELQQNATQFWSLTEKGALAYRAGQFQAAAGFAEQSLRVDSKPGRAVVNWLWLAMANQRLGKPDEARRWLGKAQKWLDQFGDGIPPQAEEELGLHLHNWLEAQILRREAEELISQH